MGNRSNVTVFIGKETKDYILSDFLSKHMVESRP